MTHEFGTGPSEAASLFNRAMVHRDAKNRLEEAAFLAAAYLLDSHAVDAYCAATIADCNDLPDLALAIVNRALEGNPATQEKDPRFREKLSLLRDAILALSE